MPEHLSEIIACGDSLIKKKNDEFLYLIHQGKRYQFHFEHNMANGKVLEPHYQNEYAREAARQAREN